MLELGIWKSKSNNTSRNKLEVCFYLYFRNVPNKAMNSTAYPLRKLPCRYAPFYGNFHSAYTASYCGVISKNEKLHLTKHSVAVVYHTVTGNTQKLAEAVASGAESISGVQGKLLPILGSHIYEGRYKNAELLKELGRASAVVFGSPTFMGSVSAQFKSFADATSDVWDKNEWSGKVAAGFTIGSNLSGDQLHTIQYMSILANQHGMLWVGIDRPIAAENKDINRLGAQSGLIAHSDDTVVSEID